VAQSGPLAYTLPQRALHWLTAALVLFNLLFPDGMNEWNHSMRQTGSATADQVSSANIHAYLGIAVLALVALRLLLRILQGVPASPSREPYFFRYAATVAHWALYGLMIAMPLTGIAAYYFGYEVVGGIHADILKVVLWIIIVGHIAGALAHHFYWKTDVLKRMTIG